MNRKRESGIPSNLNPNPSTINIVFILIVPHDATSVSYLKIGMSALPTSARITSTMLECTEAVD